MSAGEEGAEEEMGGGGSKETQQHDDVQGSILNKCDSTTLGWCHNYYYFYLLLCLDFECVCERSKIVVC